MAVRVDQVIAAINSAIKIGGALVQAGQDAAPVAKLIYDTFIKKRKVTKAELDEFIAQSDALSAELQAPLEPENT